MRISLVRLIVGGFLIVLASQAAAQSIEHEKIVGPKECGECHTAEVDAWRKTGHYRTFRELHRRKEAKKISKNLGIKRLKSESLCLNCHYTAPAKNNKRNAVAGISCESCHGAAKDWLRAHADYGGSERTRETETEQHRKQRLATVDAAGMIRREHLYEIAENCYRCHTTPEERLVNEGGHPAGSDFELLSWLSGEVRHNVFYSKNNVNEPIPLERQRLYYVVGAGLDLEYALRGVAGSTKKATYAVEMAKRAQRASKQLLTISKNVKNQEVRKMLDVVRSVKVSLNNGAELRAAADTIQELTKQFVRTADPKSLSGIDSLLPSPGDYKGKVAP